MIVFGNFTELFDRHRWPKLSRVSNSAVTMNTLIILGSSSAYRAATLDALALPYTQISPEVDEARQTGETPLAMAKRLAEMKARHVAQAHPGALVIGCDQTGECGGALLTKPGRPDAARQMLTQSSGRAAVFYSALCVCQTEAEGATRCSLDVVETNIVFRTLRAEQIEHYVARDTPLDVAGAFKAESLGIALFEKISSDDPTALIGLPMITLVTRLAEFGVDVLGLQVSTDGQ